jgi:hypothetical protein
MAEWMSMIAVPHQTSRPATNEPEPGRPHASHKAGAEANLAFVDPFHNSVTNMTTASHL